MGKGENIRRSAAFLCKYMTAQLSPGNSIVQQASVESQPTLVVRSPPRVFPCWTGSEGRVVFCLIFSITLYGLCSRFGISYIARFGPAW
jgi:hypothetical protein